MGRVTLRQCLDAALIVDWNDYREHQIEEKARADRH